MCTWLKQYIKNNERLTNEVLAAGLNVEKRTISRWINCRGGKLTRQKYQKLAALIGQDGVTAQSLEDAHLADLEQTAETARNALAEFEREKREHLRQPIDTQHIVAAMTLAGTTLGYPDVDTAVTAVTACLRSGRSVQVALNQEFQSVLEGLIAESDSDERLQQLRYLVACIATAAVLPRQRWTDGCEIRVGGEGQAWALRALVDDHNRRTVRNYQPKMILTLIRARNVTQLEPPQHCTVEIPPPKADELYGRLHEIVGHIADTGNLGPVLERDCPALDGSNGHQDFKDYCGEVDLYLGGTNGTAEHLLCFSLQNLAQTVIDELFLLIPNLRFFLHQQDAMALPVLRVSEKQLGAWVARLFRLMDARATELLEGKRAVEDSLIPTQETPMTNQQAGDVTVTVITGRNINAAVAAAHSTTTQTIGEAKALGDALQAIFEHTDAADPEHADLRFDVEAMLAKAAKGEPLPETGKQRLQRYTDQVGLGEKLLGLVNKAVDLWDRIGDALT